MFNFTLHVCANFSHGEHWCASRCWSFPTQHTTTLKQGAINNQSLRHQTKSAFQHASVAGAHSASPQVFAHHIKSCILLKQLLHKFTLQSCVWIFQI